MVSLALLAARAAKNHRSAVASTTWNPADCSSYIALSGGNLTAGYSGSGSGACLVRSTTAKSSGKWYFEIFMNTGGPSNYGAIGVLAGGTALNLTISAAGGWEYYEQTGQKGHSGVLSTFGASYSSSDVIGIAVDMSAGNIWWAKNNTWQASGNPGTGANPAFTGLTGALFAAISLYAANGPTMTGRFRTADFSYSPPSGFSPWGT